MGLRRRKRLWRNQVLVSVRYRARDVSFGNHIFSVFVCRQKRADLGKDSFSYLFLRPDPLRPSLCDLRHRLRLPPSHLRPLRGLHSQQLRPLPLQLVHLLLWDLPDDGLPCRLLLLPQLLVEFLLALRGGDVLFDEFLFFAGGERGGGEELFGGGGGGVLGEGLLAG